MNKRKIKANEWGKIEIITHYNPRDMEINKIINETIY
jgi:hypothetical protein